MSCPIKNEIRCKASKDFNLTRGSGCNNLLNISSAPLDISTFGGSVPGAIINSPSAFTLNSSLLNVMGYCNQTKIRKINKETLINHKYKNNLLLELMP